MKPCKINPEMIENLRECIKIGMSYSATSAALNISEDTFYSYMRKGREGKAPYALFFGTVREAEAELMKDCLTRLKKVADMGNMESIKFILERRFPKDWGKENNLNIKAQVESQNLSLNLNVGSKDEEKRAAIMKVLDKLNKPSFPPERAYTPQIEE